MTVSKWGQARKAATTVLEGDFPAIVTEATAGKSQNGKDQFKLKLKITSGDYVNRSLFDTITISDDVPSAMEIFFRNMEAFGLGDAFFNQLPDGDAGAAQIAAALQGKEVTVTLKGETYQGVTREKIKAYKKSNGLIVGGGVPLAAPAVVLSAPAPAPALVAPSSAPPVFAGDADTTEDPGPSF